MNSTLSVLITKLITTSGEANMDIREMTLKYPTKICRLGGSNKVRLVNAIIPNAATTTSKNPNIFSFFAFSACTMKMVRYINWKTAPMELTVATGKIPGDTMGMPYHRHIKQFKSPYIYGSPENCSVDLFLIILLNVGMGDTNSTIAKRFPAIPAASVKSE